MVFEGSPCETVRSNMVFEVREPDDDEDQDNDDGDNDYDILSFALAFDFCYHVAVALACGRWESALGPWPKRMGAEPLRTQRRPGSARLPPARSEALLWDLLLVSCGGPHLSHHSFPILGRRRRSDRPHAILKYANYSAPNALHQGQHFSQPL